MPDFDAYCNDLLKRAADAGWRSDTHKTIPYGRQYVLKDAAGRHALLNAYSGKKGFKHVVGGKDADQLNADMGGAPPAPPPAATETADPFNLGLPRIGADESGKGDYFGPLVVGAFHLDEDTAASLEKAGIADSKSLTDSAILKLAGVLDKTGRGAVLRLMPAEYNPAWRKVGNLNVLLAQLHGRCVSALASKLGPAGAILVDEFARNNKPLVGAMPKGARVETRTKGERDLAVAAASILARAAFLEGLRELEHDYGMKFPPGAGAPVLKAGRQFVKTFSADELGKVAKLHFKTTEKVGG
jgi:ribonuclease HIII